MVENAISIPKEAIRRQGADTGVMLLDGDHVVWRKVSLGISNYTKSQVLSGFKATAMQWHWRQRSRSRAGRGCSRCFSSYEPQN